MSRRKRTKISGFTLVEVMIAMFLISMMCLSVFAALQQITRTALSVASRDEAYHLMQAQAEQLLEGPYSSFVASGNVSITTSVRTSYLPSTASALTALTNTVSSPLKYTRRVVLVTSDSTSTTLSVQVSWTWQGRPEQISTQLYRTSLN